MPARPVSKINSLFDCSEKHPVFVAHALTAFTPQCAINFQFLIAGPFYLLVLEEKKELLVADTFVKYNHSFEFYNDEKFDPEYRTFCTYVHVTIAKH